MTNAPRDFSDEDLTAFLDGEAPEALARAIEQRLAEDPALAAHLDTLVIPVPALRAAFDAQLALAPIAPVVPPALPPVNALSESAAPSRGWVGSALGLGAGLAAGIALALSFGLTTPATAPQQGGWLQAVATYQMLYTPQTLAEAGPQDPSVLAELSQAVNLDLTGLAQIEGLEFRRAQQLGFNGKALIQVAYTLPDGTPFAICILQSGNDARGAAFQELQGLQAADWTTGAHGVLLIGGTDAAVLKDLAPRVQTLL